jgi:hypothetical protein
MHCAHVSKALIPNEQKNFIVDEFVHQYFFKGSNSTRRFVVLMMVRRRPYWWPTTKATFAGHERMVTELQDYILMGITRRCQQKFQAIADYCRSGNPPEPATFWSPGYGPPGSQSAQVFGSYRLSWRSL